MSYEIISGILKREGSEFTNHPADRGGPTKWGITLASWRAYINNPNASAADVQAITEEQARQFYQHEYILKPKFDKITDPALREFVVDCGVNHGIGRAVKMLQHAAKIPEDGRLITASLDVINAFPPLWLLLRTIAARTRLYGSIITKDHSQAVFAAGWTNRVAGFLDKAVDGG